MTERLSINDPRLNWEAAPPIIAIDGLEYYLLARYVANCVLQVMKDGENTWTPISDMRHALNPEILDYVFTQMLAFEWGLNVERDNMTIFSSLANAEQGQLAYVEERKAASKSTFFRGVTARGTTAFPYKTKFFQSPKFNLIDGLWHTAEGGEYEDVFCCMEMVPIACSIRFKSLLPA